MKQIKKFAAMLTLAAVLIMLSYTPVDKTASATDGERVAGGAQVVNFDNQEDADKFTFLCSSPAAAPFSIVDGKLRTGGRGEHKAIWKGGEDYSVFDVSVDISPAYSGGKIDAGFYLFASDAEPQFDGITAYNVNIERRAASDTLSIKVHTFEGKYTGCIKEVNGILCKTDTVNVRVVSKGGLVSVYVSGSKQAQLYVPIMGIGALGLRVYHTALGFDNFRLITEDTAVGTARLHQAIDDAEKLEEAKYTAESLAAVTAARQRAESALESAFQDDADSAAEALQKAINKLVVKYGYQDLTQLLARTEGLTQAEYTKNSFLSLMSVAAKAKLLTQDSLEDEISRTAALLDGCIRGLTPYVPGGGK